MRGLERPRGNFQPAERPGCPGSPTAMSRQPPAGLRLAMLRAAAVRPGLCPRCPAGCSGEPKEAGCREVGRVPRAFLPQPRSGWKSHRPQRPPGLRAPL